MQRLTYVVFISLAQCRREEKTVTATRTDRWRFRTSLASRPMTVVFGLGMRLCVRMRTQLENGVLSNAQQPSECCEWLLLTRVNLKL